MANLIDTSYFVGEISLPGQVLTGDFADINPYIIKYEREALIDLIGYSLYKELKAEIDASAYTEKWDRLVNGHEYTIDYLGDDQIVKWNGLVNSDKVSLLAYYIYFKYVQFHTTHTSGIGELIQNAENAVKSSPSQKMVNAWNRFIELRGDPYHQERILPSCYNFLDEFEDDPDYGYDKLIFTFKDRTNIFGI